MPKFSAQPMALPSRPVPSRAMVMVLGRGDQLA
jgi:hypothetical protein